MAVPQFKTLAQQVSSVAATVLYENDYSGQNYTQAQNVYIGSVTVVNTSTEVKWVSIGLAKAGEALNQLKQFKYYHLPCDPYDTLLYNFNEGIMPGDRIFWLAEDESFVANVVGIVWQNNQA